MKKVFLVLALIVLLGFILRSPAMAFDSFGEPDNYFHLRMTEMVLKEQKIPAYDSLSMQGRYYSYAPLYHVFFSQLSLLSGIESEFLLHLSVILYGLMGIFVVFALARKMFGTKTAVYSAFFLSTMVYHIIRTSGNTRPDGLALLLVPAIIYLVYCEKYRIALLLGIAQMLLHPLSSMNLILFLVLWAITAKIKKTGLSAKKVFIIIEGMVLTFLLWLNSLPYKFTEYVSDVSFESAEMAKSTLFSQMQLMLFAWIFILIGIFKSEKKNLFLVSWFLFELFYGVFGTRLGIFVAFPAAILAGQGFSIVIKKIRPYTKIFFVLVLLMALIIYIPEIQFSGKAFSTTEKNAMAWLDEFTEKDSNIFSVWDRGHALAELAKRPVVIDGYFEFAPDLNKRNESMKEIVSTSDCQKIFNEADRFKSNYFFVFNAGINSRNFRNGILEAECSFMDYVFDSDSTKIIRLDLKAEPKKQKKQ